MNAVLGRKKQRAAVLIAAALALSFIGPSAAEAGVLRSGKIVGGFMINSYYPNHLGPGCSGTPDCRTWLERQCDPSLTGRDPAMYTSIVNVRDLAGAPAKRRVILHYRDGTSVVPNYGGLTVQLWNRRCEDISGLIQVVHGYPAPRFFIPRGARWMTVASFDAINVSWTLK